MFIEEIILRNKNIAFNNCDIHNFVTLSFASLFFLFEINYTKRLK